MKILIYYIEEFGGKINITRSAAVERAKMVFEGNRWVTINHSLFDRRTRETKRVSDDFEYRVSRTVCTEIISDSLAKGYDITLRSRSSLAHTTLADCHALDETN